MRIVHEAVVALVDAAVGHLHFPWTSSCRLLRHPAASAAPAVVVPFPPLSASDKSYTKDLP